MEENKEKMELPKIDFEKEYARLNYENNLLKGKLNEAYKIINELNDNRGIERIKLLFKIVDNEGMNMPQELIDKAVAEINEVMYPKEETKETKDE